MNNGFRPAYIGKRVSKKHLPIRLLALLLLLLIPLVFLNRQMKEHLTERGEKEASTWFSALVHRAVAKELAKGTDYGSLITVTTGNDGSLLSLSADMPALLAMRTSICLEIYKEFQKDLTFTFPVPIGNLTGIDVLSGKGYSLPVSVEPARTFRAAFHSEFTEAGINQTLHRILFKIEADFSLLFPSGTKQVTVEDSFCMAETVLVGKVPDAYTEISRLTDDIDETDIDDIYDFGAHEDP